MWESQPDGSIVFVGSDPGPGGYGPVKRVTVRPAPATSVATFVNNLKAGAAKTAAEIEAAKQKAADEAAAAKAAQQQRAAEMEKARREALEAKAKARKLYLLNAQRAEQALPPLKELPADSP